MFTIRLFIYFEHLVTTIINATFGESFFIRNLNHRQEVHAYMQGKNYVFLAMAKDTLNEIGACMASLAHLFISIQYYYPVCCQLQVVASHHSP